MKSKTNLILFFAVVLIATLSYKAHQTEKLNSLLLDNVEALANGESGVSIYCLGIGSVDCPFNNTQVKTVRSGYSLEKDQY